MPGAGLVDSAVTRIEMVQASECWDREILRITGGGIGDPGLALEAREGFLEKATLEAEG